MTRTQTIQNDRLLKACRREPVDRTPVWIMRQAGRYLPSYRALRERVSFMQLCKTPELALQATLTPLEVMDVDAAILFSDILIPVEAMGMKVVFTESKGPQLPEPVRTQADIARLRVPDPEQSMPFVPDAIRLINQTLKGRIPLLGFSGAPYTLATYMIEGETSKNFYGIKRRLFEAPKLLHGLLELLADTVTAYLNAQITAGAHAVQLFDTWAGALSPAEYAEFAFPYARRVIAGLRREGTPVILYVNGGGDYLELMAETGADVLSLDWRIDIGEARRRIGHRVALQGNLDPCALYAPPETIRAQVARILQRYGRGEGHVFNLGHGILPDIPVAHAVAMVDAVHEESAQYHGAT
ncbi:MAG TPA: uroporphyrinogen decarboxylase [Nitrospiria bacterium]|nr:uroporphyrinogen decarboxylase [Nitrospiria bacterium]